MNVLKTLALALVLPVLALWAYTGAGAFAVFMGLFALPLTLPVAVVMRDSLRL